jgi:hypothetical protein
MQGQVRSVLVVVTHEAFEGKSALLRGGEDWAATYPSRRGSPS